MIPSNRHNTSSKQYNKPGEATKKDGPRRYRDGHEERLSERQKQEYPKRTRSTGAKGPFKGLSKRPPNTGTEAWKKYMSGESSTL